jgi:acid phosphatase family membrane protein YuiD
MWFEYLLLPLFAWLVTGFTKFIVNSLKAKRLAYDLIGYGGFPSNHMAIVTSMLVYIVLDQTINSPAFGAALALAVIVMFDAKSLRQQVGRQATAIKILAEKQGLSAQDLPKLRERIGHTPFELLGGVVMGVLVAWLWFEILSLLV